MNSAEPKPFNDELFAQGNAMAGIYHKTCIVDEDNEDLCHQVVKKFACDVPNCHHEFDNLLKYELHYNSTHRWSCSHCKKHLPSPHLLDLHLSEAHDSFFMAQAERKPMYRCFVETCKAMSNDCAERKQHCIEVHQFPHDFQYETKKRMEKKPKKPRHQTVKPISAEGPAPPPEQHKPPTVFTFGRKTGGKSFKTKIRSQAPTDITMDELLEALPPSPTQK